MPSASNTFPIAPSRPRWAGSSATSTSTTCVTRPKLYPELAEGRALPRSSPHPRQACAVCQTSRCAANLALSLAAACIASCGALLLRYTHSASKARATVPKLGPSKDYIMPRPFTHREVCARVTPADRRGRSAGSANSGSSVPLPLDTWYPSAACLTRDGVQSAYPGSPHMGKPRTSYVPSHSLGVESAPAAWLNHISIL